MTGTRQSRGRLARGERVACAASGSRWQSQLPRLAGLNRLPPSLDAPLICFLTAMRRIVSALTWKMSPTCSIVIAVCDSIAFRRSCVPSMGVNTGGLGENPEKISAESKVSGGAGDYTPTGGELELRYAHRVVAALQRASFATGWLPNQGSHQARTAVAPWKRRDATRPPISIGVTCRSVASTPGDSKAKSFPSESTIALPLRRLKAGSTASARKKLPPNSTREHASLMTRFQSDRLRIGRAGRDEPGRRDDDNGAVRRGSWTQPTGPEDRRTIYI